METRKKIVIGIILIAIVCIIAGIIIFKFYGDNATNDNTMKIEFQNENISLSEVIDEIKKQEDIKIVLNDESLIDFGKYDNLEKKAIVNTVSTEVEEYWFIKLKNYGQQEEIIKELGNRLRRLKGQFKENEEQTLILEKAIIKQEQGIAMLIISPNVEDVEELIDKMI